MQRSVEVPNLGTWDNHGDFGWTEIQTLCRSLGLGLGYPGPMGVAYSRLVVSQLNCPTAAANISSCVFVAQNLTSLAPPVSLNGITCTRTLSCFDAFERDSLVAQLGNLVWRWSDSRDLAHSPSAMTCATSSWISRSRGRCESFPPLRSLG